MEESFSIPPEERGDTDLDPRIQLELEKLNTATAEINKLELELEESNTTFRMLLNEATRRLKGLATRLGNCVDKARPYHEAADIASQARIACQRAAVQYQRASEIHAAAKETVALAEQRFKSKQNEWQFDNAWQEMLNHATIKVMDAEHQKAENGREHMKKAQLFNAAEHKMQQFEDNLRKNIMKSRPYFEEKQLCQEQLNTQKERIQQLQDEVQKVKDKYSKSLKALEAISEEIHHKRRALYGDSEEYPVGPREPGVGAEKDSVNDFSEELERHEFNLEPSRSSTPDSCKEDAHGLEELRKQVRRLAARPLEGGQPPEDSWEQELNTTVQKLDQMLLAREQKAREKERRAQSVHSSNDKLTEAKQFEPMTRSQSYLDNSVTSKPLNPLEFVKLKTKSFDNPTTSRSVDNSQIILTEMDNQVKRAESDNLKDLKDTKSEGSPRRSIEGSKSNLSGTHLCLSVTNLKDLVQPGSPAHFIPHANYVIPSIENPGQDDRYFEEWTSKPDVFPYDAVFERNKSKNVQQEIKSEKDVDVKFLSKLIRSELPKSRSSVELNKQGSIDRNDGTLKRHEFVKDNTKDDNFVEKIDPQNPNLSVDKTPIEFRESSTNVISNKKDEIFVVGDLNAPPKIGEEDKLAEKSIDLSGGDASSKIDNERKAEEAICSSDVKTEVVDEPELAKKNLN